MTQSATKPVDVEQAVRILRSACEAKSVDTSSRSEDIASLLSSASFLASNCTPTLLSSLLNACDATMPVAGGPKKLAMLNAAWKLLLAVVSHEDVRSDEYETALLHMIEQLRWGVLTHDWSDKKRVRLATFFASHIVLAVRAHPQLLLTGTAAARLFLGHLVRLHFAVCVTVATSMRDTEALAALYDNIVGRLHCIFECLGSAAASVTDVEGSEVKGGASVTPANSHKRKAEIFPAVSVEPVSAAFEELLVQCVSASAAEEVAEAAGGVEEVREAAATASFSAYLYVVRGVLGKLPGNDNAEKEDVVAAMKTIRGNGDEETDREAEAAAYDTAALSPARAKMLTLLTESLLSWTRHGKTHGSASSCEGALEDQADSAPAAAIQRDIQTLSKTLPPILFASSATASECRHAAPTEVSAAPSLREMWVSALASLWEQWVSVCAMDNGDSNNCGESDAATFSAQLSTEVLSSLTSTQPTSTAGLMALEAWAELFQRLEGTVAASGTPESRRRRVAVVRVLLRVLADLRDAATDLVRGVLGARRLDEGGRVARLSGGDAGGEGCQEACALVLQCVCAAVTMLSYGEAVLGVETFSRRSNDDANITERDAASDVVSALVEMVRAELGSSPRVAEEQGGNDLGGEAAQVQPSSSAAVAGLRDVLAASQQEAKKAFKQKTLSAAQSFCLCRLLIQVPRRLHQVVRAFIASSASPHTSSLAFNDEVIEVSLEQLKQTLLSCSPLFASLTQTLQTLAEASLAEGEEEEEVLRAALWATQVRNGCVARWVATRLIHEIAVVPITDSADDGFLLACVRRWTDVAFSSLLSHPSVSCGANAARLQADALQRSGAAVMTADAAASLLRVAEECTTLDLEKLNLSESATVALMGLIEGESQEAQHADDMARWHALLAETARQWSVVHAWTQRQASEDDATWEVSDNLVVSPATPPPPPEQPSLSLRSSPTVASLLRGLQHCEAVLEQVHQDVQANLLLMREGGPERKRHRADVVGEGSRGVWAGEEESACLMRALARIRELSQSTLTQLEGDTKATTPVSSSPLSIHAAIKAEFASCQSEGELRRDTQVFTLSDTESIGSRRRPSSAEVIDIE